MAAPPPPAPTREARLARRLLWLIPTLSVSLLVVVRVLVSSDFVSQPIAELVATRIANRTGASVQLSGMSFDLSFAPCMHDLTIYRRQGPLELRVVAKRACVERWASAIGSGFRAVRLRFEQTRIEAAGRTEPSKASAAVDVRPDRVRSNARAPLQEVEVSFDDLQLDWDALPLPARFASGSFGPIDGDITVQRRGRKSAAIIALRDRDTDAQVNARANPTDDGWNLSAGLEGDLVGMFGSLLEFSAIDIQRMPVRGRAGLNYVSAEQRLTLDLDLEEHDAAVESDAVAKGTVAGFTARQRLRAELDLARRTVRIEDGLIEINGFPAVVSLAVEPGKTSPAFRLQVDLRTSPFVRLLKSVPGGAELPITRRISPRLGFALAVSVSGELRNPGTWQPDLTYQFRAIDTAKTFTGLEALSAPFEYFPLTPDGRTETARIVGPTTRTWVPYSRIPYLQRRAIIVSEDANFPFHKGVDLDEVRAALQDAIAGSERPRGGSTISQQLIKNLFLSRDRTAQRKALELLLTLHLESWKTKDEIFALYANIIEWGPDVYGLGEASQHYFGRPPWRLSALEMAYLATLIPSPVRLHAHFEKGAVPRSHMRKVYSLLDRLNRLGQLPDQKLAEAKSSRIRFARARERATKKGTVDQQ